MLMISRQMTARDVARAAQLTETTTQRLTKPGAKANARTVGKLAIALGVDGDELILQND